MATTEACPECGAEIPQDGYGWCRACNRPTDLSTLDSAQPEAEETARVSADRSRSAELRERLSEPGSLILARDAIAALVACEARADRLETLLQEARDVIAWHDEQDYFCMLEANDALIARIDAEVVAPNGDA